MKPTRVVIEGEVWFLYSAVYQHEGRSYAFDLYAPSQEEADAMLKSIRQTAIECYRIEAQFQANAATGIWVRLLCWFKNIFS